MSGFFPRSGLLPKASKREPRVLDRAVAAWSANAYSPRLDALIDITGRGHHARLGSTVGEDTNDPLVLQYEGRKYLRLAGESGNYATNGDSGVFHANPSVETVVAEIGHDTWRGDGGEDYAGGIDSTRMGYGVDASGHLIFRRYFPGIPSTLIRSSSEAIPDSTSGPIAIRIDADWATGSVTFYTAERLDANDPKDGTSWTQFGEVRTFTPPAEAPGTARVLVGTYSSAYSPNPFSVYRQMIYQDNALVSDFNADDSEEPHQEVTSSTTGEIWEIHRTAEGRKAVLVDRPTLLLGTDDFLVVPNSAEHPDFALTPEWTVAVAYRFHGDYFDGWLVDTKRGGSNDPGFNFYGSSGGIVKFRIADGSGQSAQDSPTLTTQEGFAMLSAGQRDDGLIRAYLEPALSSEGSDPYAGQTLPSDWSMAIGAASYHTSGHADMEFIGAALFQEALTPADLTALAAEFGIDYEEIA